MEWTGFGVALLFAGVAFLCVLLVPLGLPGTWLMLLIAVALEMSDGRFRTGADPITFGWPALGLSAALAVTGEVLEAIAGAAGSRFGGGSPRGMLGAIVGGVLGAIALTPLIPLPLIGTLIGALIGTFVGAWLGEASARRARHPAETFRAAAGATLGRLAGTLGKSVLAIVNWLLLVGAALHN